ncbi:NAD(P)H-dependent FMN reductase [Propionibacterium cyclohexanicum]|uniref:NAD(P)H-dependent FMN reductase n=1 Tax=Propionibacterium cyclohexanicum TaxID=64702 RepID=A0A1H9RG92_9ACTN|nr:NAD(P)H-dependent oxidoreductase [Propionibacterium cyclohexanicum]SER71820.1 NAD(P)H-dependent FMN reductase [Propionibacterium cyclohexanicum]
MKVGIIVGSVRTERLGESVAQWVYELASQRGDAEYVLIDLADFRLPVFDGDSPMRSHKQYAKPEVQRWSDAIDACDGYIVVTPEYNHSVPGALKNAVDSLGPEWLGKTVGFVSYGADAGVRAVEHWRQIVANFEMHDIRSQVSLGLFTDFNENGFAPQERRSGELTRVLDSLVPVSVS